MYPVCNCVKLVPGLCGIFIMNLHIPSVHVGREESSAVGNPQILRKLLKVATDCHPHFQRQYYAVWEVGLLFVQLKINMCSKYNFFLYISHYRKISNRRARLLDSGLGLFYFSHECSMIAKL